jgi:hypothetical protein
MYVGTGTRNRHFWGVCTTPGNMTGLQCCFTATPLVDLRSRGRPLHYICRWPKYNSKNKHKLEEERIPISVLTWGCGLKVTMVVMIRSCHSSPSSPSVSPERKIGPVNTGAICHYRRRNSRRIFVHNYCIYRTHLFQGCRECVFHIH